jgi:hypothetical protein
MLCACGCGKETRLAPGTVRRKGWVKGQPMRFLRGHGRSRPVAQRFWEKVDECWPWQASKCNYGYGQLEVNGRPMRSNRLTYELTHGSIPDELEALHTCNNPPCCNPAHIYAGTQTDNMQDAKKAGRLHKFALKPGTAYPRAKLDDDKVRFIRSAYAAGTVTLKQLGMQFNVTEQMIWLVVHRKKWQHVM